MSDRRRHRPIPLRHNTELMAMLIGLAVAGVQTVGALVVWAAWAQRASW